MREVRGVMDNSLNPYTKTDLSFPFPLFSIEYKIDLTHLTYLHGALFDGKRFIILANLKNLTEDKVPMGLVAVC